MQNQDILIVDDNLINLKLMRVLFTGEGFEVRTASSAKEALQAIQAQKPDVVLADIQMPGMDGLEMTKWIKADPATKELPVIAVTAYAMSADQERAKEAGCDAYVSKPIDTRTLPDLVRGVLRKGK